MTTSFPAPGAGPIQTDVEPGPAFPVRPTSPQATPPPAASILADPYPDNGDTSPHPAGEPAPPRQTMLEALGAELASEVEVKEFRWRVPGRAGYEVEYRQIMEFAEIDRATKTSDRNKGKRNRQPDVDPLRASAIILSSHNIAIYREDENGEPQLVLDDNGNPMTMRSPELAKTLGISSRTAGDVQQRLKLDSRMEWGVASLVCAQLYGAQQDFLKAGNRLSDESGWGEAFGDEADPTRDE